MDSATTEKITEIADAVVANPRLAGLRPWKPGQSGNPAGRPRFTGFSDALRELCTPDVCKRVAVVILKKAQAGSVPHLAIVLDRLEGRVDASDGESGGVVLNITISAPRPKRKATKPILDVTPTDS